MIGVAKAGGIVSRMRITGFYFNSQSQKDNTCASQREDEDKYAEYPIKRSLGIYRPSFIDHPSSYGGL